MAKKQTKSESAEGINEPVDEGQRNEGTETQRDKVAKEKRDTRYASRETNYCVRAVCSNPDCLSRTFQQISAASEPKQGDIITGKKCVHCEQPLKVISIYSKEK